MTDPIKLAIEAQCRESFVQYTKAEQADRDPVYRQSLEAHRRGKAFGFYHDGTQAKWRDYRAAWFAALRSIKPDCRNCEFFESANGEEYCQRVDPEVGNDCTNYDKFQAMEPVCLTKEKS